MANETAKTKPKQISNKTSSENNSSKSEDENKEINKNKDESIIEKIEDKVKEIGEDIKEGFKETIEEVEEEVKKIEDGAKKIIHKIEGKKEKTYSKKEVEEHKKGEIEKSHSRHHPIKEKSVNKLVDKMQNAKTVMIVNIKGLPSKQFQDIKKSIREHAQILVAKKNIITRAIEKFGKESITPLEEKISENCALAISDMEGYELAGILSQKKTPVAAKAGQEAPEDIEVRSGPTNLVPGPAISELGAVGLQVAVKDGKLSIKASKVIIKKGQMINEAIASILQKLDILPFTVGLEPIAIYDVEEEKIYTDIKIDSEETVENLKSAAGKALGFAQKIVYFCKDTIGYLLAKANADNQALDKLSEIVSSESKDSKVSIDAESKDSITEPKEKAKAKEKTEEKPEEGEKAEEVKEKKPMEDGKKEEPSQPEIKSEEEK